MRGVIFMAVLADAMPCAHHGPPPEYDTSGPARVVELLVDAARTGNDASLPGLCEHTGLTLSDYARSVCRLHKGDPGWAAFAAKFKDATIGPIVLDHGSTPPRADVPLGGQHDVHLVFDSGAWFLDSVD